MLQTLHTITLKLNVFLLQVILHYYLDNCLYVEMETSRWRQVEYTCPYNCTLVALDILNVPVMETFQTEVPFYVPAALEQASIITDLTHTPGTQDDIYICAKFSFQSIWQAWCLTVRASLDQHTERKTSSKENQLAGFVSNPVLVMQQF